PAAHAAAVRADPEGAVLVLEERLDVVALHPGRVRPVENGELDPVEPDEPLLRAEPEVAIPRLEHRVDRVLGEAFAGLPDLVAVLRDRLARIEGIRPSAGEKRDKTEQSGQDDGARPREFAVHDVAATRRTLF